ncbi:ABC transporter substrate-binding protein [Phenylobacterium sp.]|uniref:ABC transporter substrate-binding protein n=1 Tax=Phenylobacterium sp. TaxID=1871053 RepID=UPI00301D0982
MSMNMCTDLLLLQLVPKARIAAVTYLAHGAVEAVLPGADAGVPINYGTSEDILRYRPDLILAGDFSTPVTRRLAKRVGAHIFEVESVNDFEGIRRIVRQVGAAVGEPARAEAMVRDMDAKLAGLAARPPARRLRVVAWSGGTSVPGKGTLSNAIIEAAGGVNIAAQPGVNYTTFDVEQLLAADPDALLFGGVRSGKPSLRSDEGKHRVVRRYYGDRRISYNEVGYTCGLPQSAEAAVELRRALDGLPPRAWRLK